MIVHLKSSYEKINALDHDLKFIIAMLNNKEKIKDFKALQIMLCDAKDIVEEMIETMQNEGGDAKSKAQSENA